MRWLAAFVTGALLLGAPGSAGAEDDLDDVLGGFEEEAPEAPAASETEDGATGSGTGSAPGSASDLEIAVEPEAGSTDRWWDLSGSLSLGTSINYLEHRANAFPKQTDYTGLSRLQTELALQFDADLPRDWKARVEGYVFYDWAYLANGRDNYTREVLDVYEWDFQIMETWVQGEVVDGLDLKLGRQIVNWGRSDSLRVLDVINPLDNREPGLVDFEDLRWPVTMARADYYLGDWSFTALLIPEIRVSLNPPYGSDFNPQLLKLPPVKEPPQWGGNPEFGAALNGTFRGWDVSFNALRYTANQPRLDANPTRLVYDRRTLVGAGGNVTLGSFLLKGEVAWIEGIGFFNHPDTKQRIDALAGVEYYGFENTVVAFELASRNFLDFEGVTRLAPDLADPHTLEGALRVTTELMNARLRLIGLAATFGDPVPDGAFVRLSAEYDLRDALTIGGGILLFITGDLPPTSSWGNNDRLFAEIVWSF